MEYDIKHYRLGADGKFFLMQMGSDIKGSYYLVHFPRANTVECGTVHMIIADNVQAAKESATAMMLDMLAEVKEATNK